MSRQDWTQRWQRPHGAQQWGSRDPTLLVLDVQQLGGGWSGGTVCGAPQQRGAEGELLPERLLHGCEPVGEVGAGRDETQRGETQPGGSAVLSSWASSPGQAPPVAGACRGMAEKCRNPPRSQKAEVPLSLAVGSTEQMSEAPVPNAGARAGQGSGAGGERGQRCTVSPLRVLVALPGRGGMSGNLMGHV